MAYTNSPLVSYTKLSPNHSGQRTHSIDRITPHCVVGQCSVETLGNIFLPTSRQASSNYGIGVDGRVGMYVEEKNRSWCSSSAANDQRAITIECASDNTEPYAFKDVVYKSLIELCTDMSAYIRYFNTFYAIMHQLGGHVYIIYPKHAFLHPFTQHILE